MCDHIPGRDAVVLGLNVIAAGNVGRPVSREVRWCTEMNVTACVPQGKQVDLWGDRVIGAAEVCGLDINAETVVTYADQLRVNDVFILEVDEAGETIERLLAIVMSRVDRDGFKTSVRYRVLTTPTPTKIRFEYNKLDCNLDDVRHRLFVVANYRHHKGDPDEWARIAMTSNK